MIMKRTVAVLLGAIAICCWTYALAGSVEIGFVEKAGLRRWMAGGPAQVPAGEAACTPAKFNQTSPCPTIVISNHSSHAVTLSFTTSSEEFAAGVQSGVVIGGSGPLPCSRLNVHDRLEPGASCFESVDFWPRTGEVHHGTTAPQQRPSRLKEPRTTRRNCKRPRRCASGTRPS